MSGCGITLTKSSHSKAFHKIAIVKNDEALAGKLRGIFWKRPSSPFYICLNQGPFMMTPNVKRLCLDMPLAKKERHCNCFPLGYTIFFKTGILYNPCEWLFL